MTATYKCEKNSSSKASYFLMPWVCACALSLIGFARYVINFKVRCIISCFSDFFCLIIDVSWSNTNPWIGCEAIPDHLPQSGAHMYICSKLIWILVILCFWLDEDVLQTYMRVNHAVTLTDDVLNLWVIDQACSIKMVGYWPRSFFASLWTEMQSKSISKQKKKLIESKERIQPCILIHLD